MSLADLCLTVMSLRIVHVADPRLEGKTVRIVLDADPSREERILDALLREYLHMARRRVHEIV
jgi:hypothetical protein